ncbi:MAG: class I SAM-dependent methyltransferase [Halanaeroarchaeum sp.]
MPRVEPFEHHPDRYDEWFARHEPVYRSELRALERFVDPAAYGIAIGVGSGRFAAPLNVEVGVDPSPEMLSRATDRGVRCIRGVAERLPVSGNRFEVALSVTAVCFVDDIAATLREAMRVLRPGGSVVLGYIDRESDLGKRYEEHKEENPFYRDATFVSTAELTAVLEDLGYRDIEMVQTVFQPPDAVADLEPVRSGSGEGSFVALKAEKPDD